VLAPRRQPPNVIGHGRRRTGPALTQVGLSTILEDVRLRDLRRVHRDSNVRGLGQEAPYRGGPSSAGVAPFGGSEAGPGDRANGRLSQGAIRSTEP